jgi:hypothetical protein
VLHFPASFVVSANLFVKPTYIRIGMVGLAIAVMALEIALPFLSFGPFPSPLRSASDFYKVTNLTRKSGRKPCIVCGRPAVPIHYRTEPFGTTGTVEEFCAAHAPSSFNQFDELSMNRDFSIWLRFLFMLIALLVNISVLKIVRAPDSNILNANFVKQNFLVLLLSVGSYTFVTAIFFWSQQHVTP